MHIYIVPNTQTIHMGAWAYQHTHQHRLGAGIHTGEGTCKHDIQDLNGCTGNSIQSMQAYQRIQTGHTYIHTGRQSDIQQDINAYMHRIRQIQPGIHTDRWVGGQAYRHVPGTVIYTV